MSVIENEAVTIALQDGEQDPKEPQEPKEPKEPKHSPWFWILAVTAWMGVFTTFNMRNYTSGFILKFTSDNGINKTICNVAIASFFITSTIAPIVVKASGLFCDYHIKIRTAIYGGFVIICNALLVLADYIVYWDKSFISLYLFFTTIRLLQGFGAGCLMVIIQGEVVDVFFEGNVFEAGCISSGIHVSTTISCVLSAALYEAGGWTYTAPAFSFLLLIPVISLKFINLDKVKVAVAKDDRTSHYEDDKEIKNSDQKSKAKLTLLQRIAFMLPDLVVFLNNAMYIMLIYSIPYRLLYSSSYSLTIANLYISLMSAVSFIATFALSYASVRINAIVIMIFGNMCFYVGAICMYGSTTSYLMFPGSLEIGAILVGFGDAAIINLCVICKFYLYKVWKRDLETIGVKAVTYFNFSLSMSAMFGIVLSGITSTKESEIPTLFTSGISFVITSLSLIFCNFSR